MDSKTVVRGTGTLLLAIFGFQSILISSGIPGIYILHFRKLCTCDHSQISKSLESHPEDKFFYSTLTLPGLFPGVDSLDEMDSEICHHTTESEAHPSSPHFCPHETIQQIWEYSFLSVATLSFPKPPTTLHPDFQSTYFSFDFSIFIFDGFRNSPFEPPESV